MKRENLIFFLILALFSSSVYGLNVELSFPVDNAVYVDSNTVVFKCKAIGNDLRFIELYNNVNGWGKKAEVINPVNNTDAVFSIKNISNGNYLWNCKTIDGIEGIKFSNVNRSFSVNIAPNNVPSYNGGLVSLSWNMNTQKNNAFDLDNYFSDVDGDFLSYSVSGNANINVIIGSNNVVSFSQPTNWFGTEKIYFTASDGELGAGSNYINLTVIKTESGDVSGGGGNTAPFFTSEVPDQNKSLDEVTWLLDLNSYIKDNEDANSKLNLSIDGVNNDLIKIDIDNVNKRFKFTSNQKTGTDTITVFVFDSNGANASQNIKINLYKKDSASESASEFDEQPKDFGSSLVIQSYSPEAEDVLVKENEIKVFSVDTNIKGDVEWYLDGELTKETSNHFNFNSRDEGEHNLTVYVSDLDKTVTRSWNVIIKESVTETEASVNLPVCGNNIIESNENCLNCPSDVKCLENQICENEICAEKKSGLIGITGNFLRNVNFNSNSLKIFYVFIGAFIILLISVLIIRKRNKTKYSYLGEFGEKETFLTKIQRKLREIDKKRKQKKENKNNIKILEKQKDEEVINIAPSALSITNFIKDNLEKGHTKETIKKALKGKGWSRLQIWKAFKKI